MNILSHVESIWPFKVFAIFSKLPLSYLNILAKQYIMFEQWDHLYLYYIVFYVLYIVKKFNEQR